MERAKNTKKFVNFDVLFKKQKKRFIKRFFKNSDKIFVQKSKK